jgi:hypothetical protein
MLNWLFGKSNKPKPKNKTQVEMAKSSRANTPNKRTYPLVHKAFFKHYENTGHCKPLCYKNTGKPVSFDYKLTRKEPARGEYLFVIRASQPESIYYFSANLNLLMNSAMNCETKQNRTIHHDCLGRNKPVLCAGTLIFHGNRMVTLINNSGHYLPKAECLHYTANILKKRLGYRISDFNYY